jgi:septal ring factor EnvC (AmiA/AmiB activator)
LAINFPGTEKGPAGDLARHLSNIINEKNGVGIVIPSGMPLALSPHRSRPARVEMKYRNPQYSLVILGYFCIFLLALTGCSSLKSENEKLKEEIVDINAENEKLRKELNTLKTENSKMHLRVAQLHLEIAALHNEIQNMQKDIDLFKIQLREGDKKKKS